MAKCFACGAQVVWGIDTGGTRIPLDMDRTPVYRIAASPERTPGLMNKEPGDVLLERVHQVWVDHRRVCPAETARLRAELALARGKREGGQHANG